MTFDEQFLKAHGIQPDSITEEKPTVSEGIYAVGHALTEDGSELAILQWSTFVAMMTANAEIHAKARDLRRQRNAALAGMCLAVGLAAFLAM